MTSLIRRDAVNTRPGKNPLSLRAILEHASVGKPKHHIGEVSLPDRELYTVHEFKSINGWISRRFYYKNGVKCDLFGRTINDPGFNSNSHTAQTYPEPHPIVPTGGKKRTRLIKETMSSSEQINLLKKKIESDNIRENLTKIQNYRSALQNGGSLSDFNTNSNQIQPSRHIIYPPTPSKYAYPGTVYKKKPYQFPYTPSIMQPNYISPPEPENDNGHNGGHNGHH